MGRTVDPKSDEYKKRDAVSYCRAGDKLMAAVGFERYLSKNRKRMLEVRFVCLEDLAKNGDERKITRENFCLERSSMFRFAQFASAIGYDEVFDPDDDANIESIISNGYVIATLGPDVYNGKMTYKVKDFNPPGEGEDDPEWADWIAEAEAGFAKYMEWRAKNPRDAAGGGNRGGGQRGARQSGDSSGGESTGHSRGGGHEEDIPF